MTTVMRRFRNELDNTIEIAVVEDASGITIHATGPTSTVMHTWTRSEAATIQALLNFVLEEDPTISFLITDLD